jgi:hypothetical protein
MAKMERRHFLAAQIYGYSYTHYAENLEKENVRFTTLMPGEVEILEQAEREDWEPNRLAEALGIEEDKVSLWQDLYQVSKHIVDAGTCVDSFRASIRSILKAAASESLDKDEVVERIAAQICYQTADLGYLLDQENRRLSDYGNRLRQTNSINESWLIVYFGDIADEF